MTESPMAARLDLLIHDPSVPALVAAYFDPAGHFAAHTFDTVGENPPNEFVPADLLAVSLLDVSYGPRAVRMLLDDTGLWSSRLAATRQPGTPLWEIDDEQYESASTLWKELRALPGVGPTKASKLLARKRPALIPIIDRVITEFLVPGPRGFWWDLHDALQSQTRREKIDLLGANVAPRSTTLRLIDVATWMRFSQSRNAIAARLAAEAPSQSVRDFLEARRP